MINPYSYVRQDNGVNINLKEETRRWFHYRVDFPSAQSLKYLGNNRVVGEYIFPRNVEKAPLAILIHGMGERSVIPCRLIAHTLARHGIASFSLYLVFHQYRAPDSMKGKYPGLTAEEWFESYQLSVTDIRQVVDWAAGRKEIIQDQISVVGISFGGFISTIAMALDDRIKAGVFIVTGGNSDKITRQSLLLRFQYKQSRDDYLRNQDAYRLYLSEVSEKGFESVIAGKSSYLTDPLTFSKYVKNRPVIMINAFWDEMIPRGATLDLWKAYGKPPITWFPATHASIWLWYPLMGRKISAFHKSVFKLAGQR
jgi:cephalosporin-C deacetylase-like acetyl esterase